MSRIRIGFRVDGSRKLGMGHVKRCLALAKVLNRNCISDVVFIMKAHKKTVKKVREAGFQVKTVPRNIDINEELMLLYRLHQEFMFDIIIVDLRGIGKRYLARLKQWARVLVVIHDLLEDKRFPSDMSVNYNLYAKDLVRERIKKKIKSCFGPRFFILDDTFAQFKKKFKIVKKGKKILVTFGGSDQSNLTTKTFRALDRLPRNLDITIVLGPFFAHYAELEKAIVASNKTCRIEHDVDNMAELMLKNDLIITTGGNTCFEAALIGIPSIILSRVKVQNENARKLEKLGVSVNLDIRKFISEEVIGRTVENLLQDKSIRQKMSIEGQKLIDGKGAQRVAEEILNCYRAKCITSD